MPPCQITLNTCCKFTTESVSERILKSVSIWRSYGQDYGGSFFDSKCIYIYISVSTLHAHSEYFYKSVTSWRPHTSQCYSPRYCHRQSHSDWLHVVLLTSLKQHAEVKQFISGTKSAELLEHLENMQVNVTGEEKWLQRADVTVDLLMMLKTTISPLTTKLAKQCNSAYFLLRITMQYGSKSSNIVVVIHQVNGQWQNWDVRLCNPWSDLHKIQYTWLQCCRYPICQIQNNWMDRAFQNVPLRLFFL